MALRAPVGANKTVSSRSWKGPNDPKTLPRDMIHNYRSCWPTLGPYRYLRGAPKGPFGLKQALTGRKALGARVGARFGPNCHRLVRLGWSHGYHTFWPGNGPLLVPQGPQKGPFWPNMPVLAQNASFGSPGGPRRVPTPSGCCAWAGLMVTTNFGLVSSLFLATILIFGPILGPHGPKKGTFRAKTGTFGAPGCQEEAPYPKSNLGTAAGGSWVRIWLPGALRVPPRPPKGAFWAKTSPFGAPGGQKEV